MGKHVRTLDELRSAVNSLEAALAGMAQVVDQVVVANEAIRKRLVAQDFRDAALAEALPWGNSE